MRFGEPQTREAAFARIQKWHEQQAELAACFAAAGGGMHVVLQGRIVRLSQARLVLEGDTVQLAFNLGGCRFDYGPVDFVVWPGNRMRAVNGLHIVTDRAHWLFLAERDDSPFLLFEDRDSQPTVVNIPMAVKPQANRRRELVTSTFSYQGGKISKVSQRISG